MNIGNLQNTYSETDSDEKWNEAPWTFNGECSWCKIIRLCISTIDPVIKVGGEDCRYEAWCKSCYLKRQGDI